MTLAEALEDVKWEFEYDVCIGSTVCDCISYMYGKVSLQQPACILYLTVLVLSMTTYRIRNWDHF